MTGKGRYLIGVLFLCGLFLLVFGTVAVGRAASGDLARAVTVSLDVTAPSGPPPPGAVTAGLDATDSYNPAPASTGRGPGLAPQIPDSPSSIGGSTVTTADCYEAASTKTMCFTVYNGSTDAEYLDQVRLTFPTIAGAWTVACNSQDATDSSGSPVGFTCSASGNEVTYSDTDTETPTSIGEVTAGSTWGFCVDVTVPSGYTGPRYVQWGLSGDEDGALPHDVSGATEIEICTPLMLSPNGVVIEGCNGVAATPVFQLWNHTGSAGTFNLNYSVSSGNATFTGPSSLSLSADETVTFTVSLTPDLCLATGGTVVASLTAEDNGNSDSSTLVETIGEFGGFQLQAPSPMPTMDSVVAWAIHDGGLWSIGGIGAPGQTQRYDPASGVWTTHTAHTSPTIEYPMDGCYGLDGDGHEVIVLFPDTVLTGTLAQYDIDDDAWTDLQIPTGYPAEGRWGHDVTSLYGVTGDNICYLSGGSTQVGGGRTRDLWSYNPATNITVYLGPFTHVTSGFNFHASWFVPWVGEDGAICVAGGTDFNQVPFNATQCYDLHTGAFNAPNADLGPLPEQWWGMADGWKIHKGRHQIWLANGVRSDGALIGKSAYADATTCGFVYGPDPAVDLYRTEGDGWQGEFFAEQGAAGFFDYTAYNQKLVQCPRCFEWDKFVNGAPWTPDLTLAAEVSDTIQITDIFTTEESFDLVETWDPDRLEVLAWSVQPLFSGDVVTAPGEIHFAFHEPHPFVFTVTKWLHVEPCMWESTVLSETVWIGGEVIDQKPFVVNKIPPDLWIDSFFDVSVQPGHPAQFTLVYGNTGGYENGVVITNTFPVTAPFSCSNPTPDAVGAGGAWARWELGDLATGSEGTIVVEVDIDAGLMPGTFIPIWDGIFNHMGVLADQTEIMFKVGEPGTALWRKWINGMPWYPGITVTLQTSDTLVIVDVVETPADGALLETWDIDHLELIDVECTPGTGTTPGPVGTLLWELPPTHPAVVTLTKTFHVLTCTWPATELIEELRVPGMAQPEVRFVRVFKELPVLQIDSAYESDVQPGTEVTFTLQYSNTGGFESAAWIMNEFPPAAPFVRADPAPDAWDTADGLWARWDLGALAGAEAGTITVTIGISAGLEISTSFPVWDGIFDHMDVMRDETFLRFHVAPPPPPEWTKWVNGVLWEPGLAVTAQTSDTVEIVDVVVSGQQFAIKEYWEQEHLALTGWEIEPPGWGQIMTTPFSIVWEAPPMGPNDTFTFTKRFHVEPCIWPATELAEELWVGPDMAEQRRVIVLKELPQLWIQSAYQPEIYAGRFATFTLSYGNTGGFESAAGITNEFPPEAPFADAYPYPDEVAPNNRLVSWNLGSLATDDSASIVVTVSVTSALPSSSTVVIWDGIFNHIGVLRDETFITTIAGYQVYLPLVLRFY